MTYTTGNLAPADSLVAGIPAPENKVFYPALDGLRATAALLVFAHHYLSSIAPPSLRWGWVGVDIFFVLSGFLITGILFDTRDQPHRMHNFYVRRTLRIFPLYYGVLALVLLTTPLLHWAWSRVWILAPLYLLNYTRFAHPVFNFSGELLYSRSLRLPLNFGHFWTLCVEEQFYLAWPFVVFSLRDRVRLRNVCLATVLVVPLLRLATRYLVPPHYLTIDLLGVFPLFRVDTLLLGGALALMLRGPEAERLRRLAAPIFIASSIAFAAAWLVAVRLLHQSSAADRSVPWVSTLGISLIACIAAGILLLTLRPGTLFFRIFSLRPLRWLGQMSYGFYIFHFLPSFFFTRLGPYLFQRLTTHFLLPVALVAFVVTLTLTYLSFRFLEAPFLRLKDRFTL